MEAIALVTPESYEIPRDSSEWKAKVDEPLQSLTRRAHEVFSKEEGAEIFSNLGGTKPSSNDRNIEPNVAPGPRDCNCSRESDWCWNYCGGGPCGVPDSGCGTFWQYWCTGTCQ
ncbi:MAG: bacteriocin fulvocin C-related protein [Acidobacteria bacterium]|nr:bacteriocin fulvocin C-related protein [Acidobacteriota bacterium]